MAVSIPLLVFGLSMTAIGVAMILLSLRPRDAGKNVEHRGAALIFLGPIPIFFAGKGRWALMGVTVAAVIALLLVVASMHPDLIGW
jgi:uncharacterized membrane protein